MKKVLLFGVLLAGAAAVGLSAFQLAGSGWVMNHKGSDQCIGDSAVGSHLRHGDLFVPINPWNDPMTRCK